MSFQKLAHLSNQEYLNLETYKKTGQAVRTPLWFVEESGVLYARTLANYSKVKRIRNNPHVRLVACDARGRPRGVWIEGQARFADTSESQKMNRLFARKYGWEKTWFDILARLRGRKWVFIAVQV